jgi:hypothetical protein
MRKSGMNVHHLLARAKESDEAETLLESTTGVNPVEFGDFDIRKNLA